MISTSGFLVQGATTTSVWVVVSRIRRAYVAIFYGQKQGRNQSCFTMFSRLSRFSLKTPIIITKLKLGAE